MDTISTQSAIKKNNRINIHNTPSRLALWTVILVFLIMSACDDSTDPGPLTGEVVGLVQPVDQWSNPVTDSSAYENIEVQLEQTSKSAATDSSGRYAIEDVEAGTYTLAVSKSDYGTNKLPFYQFIGGGQDFVQEGTPIEIGEIPDYEISADSAFVDQGALILEGSISTTIPDGGLASTVTYISDHPDISPDDPSTYITVNAGSSFPGTQKFTAVFEASNFIGGQELYLKSYPAAKSSLFYLDPSAKTSKIIFSSLGQPTDEIRFVLPDKAKAKGSNKVPGNSLNISLMGPNKMESRDYEIPKGATSKDIMEIREQIDSYVANTSAERK